MSRPEAEQRHQAAGQDAPRRTSSAGSDFRVAVEAADLDRAISMLAPDVVFHSPATFKPFEGREMVGHVLRAVFTVFADFRYVAELEGNGATALVFKARVGEREVDGIDLVRENADGLIDDFTVLVRPLSGLQALAQAMGERLGARPPSA